MINFEKKTKIEEPLLNRKETEKKNEYNNKNKNKTLISSILNWEDNVHSYQNKSQLTKKNIEFSNRG